MCERGFKCCFSTDYLCEYQNNTAFLQRCASRSYNSVFSGNRSRLAERRALSIFRCSECALAPVEWQALSTPCVHLQVFSFSSSLIELLPVPESSVNNTIRSNGVVSRRRCNRWHRRCHFR